MSALWVPGLWDRVISINLVPLGSCKGSTCVQSLRGFEKPEESQATFVRVPK